MAMVCGELVGGKKGKGKVTVKVSGTFANPSHWDDFFAQLKALGARYNISVSVQKSRARKAAAATPAKKKAAKKAVKSAKK